MEVNGDFDNSITLQTAGKMNDWDETEHVAPNSDMVDSGSSVQGQLNAILETEDSKLWNSSMQVYDNGQANESPFETNTGQLLNATYTVKKKPPSKSSVGQRTNLMNLSSDILQDSTLLRQAVYKRWYLEKLEDARRRWTAMKLKEKTEEDKKTQEQEAKLSESKAIYESWLRQKKNTIKKKVQEERKRDSLIKEKEEDKANRRREAEIVFNVWRERKEVVIKEQKLKKREQEMEEARDKEDEMWEKKQDSLSAFQTWKSTKDEKIRRKVEQEEEEKDHKRHVERIMKEERDLKAVEAYEYWLVSKELASRKGDTGQPRPPWCPT